MALCVSPHELRAALEKLLICQDMRERGGSKFRAEPDSRDDFDSAESSRSSSADISPRACLADALNADASFLTAHDTPQSEAASTQFSSASSRVDQTPPTSKSSKTRLLRKNEPPARPSTAQGSRQLQRTIAAARQLERSSCSLKDRRSASRACAPRAGFGQVEEVPAWPCFGSWKEVESSCKELDQAGQPILGLDLTHLLEEGPEGSLKL